MRVYVARVSLRLQGASDAGSSSSDDEEDGAEQEGGGETGEQWQRQQKQKQVAGEAANGTAGDVTMGEATDGATDGGVASGPEKRRRQRRDSIEGYERDFIDDGEEIEYERRRTAKAKFRGFGIIKVTWRFGDAPGVLAMLPPCCLRC